jgi:hypothetical protein
MEMAKRYGGEIRRSLPISFLGLSICILGMELNYNIRK